MTNLECIKDAISATDSHGLAELMVREYGSLITEGGACAHCVKGRKDRDYYYCKLSPHGDGDVCVDRVAEWLDTEAEWK